MASAPLDHYLEELDPLNAVDVTTIVYAASDPNYDSFQLPISVLFTSPQFQGSPKAPTPPGSDSSDRLATTAFVKGQMTGFVHITGDESIAGIKTFTTSIKSSAYYLIGPTSSYTVNRRNDGGNAWQIFSQSGELSFWDYASSSTIASISTAGTTAGHMFSINSQAIISGPLYIGSSLNITINQSSTIGWRLAGDGVGNMYFQSTNNSWSTGALLWKGDSTGNLTLSPLPVSLGSSTAGAQFKSLGTHGNSHWIEYTDGRAYYDAYAGHVFRNTSGGNAASFIPGYATIYGPGADTALEVRGAVSTVGTGAADLFFSNTSVTTGTIRLAGIQGLTDASVNTGRLNFLIKKAATDTSLTPVAYFNGSGSFFTNGDVTVGGNLTILGTTSGGSIGGTPGGVTGDIQFNNAGTFAGFGNWNGTTLTVNTFAGSGAGLTNLNASNLASGTVPVARLGLSGIPSTTTFLRGDNTWSTVPIGSVTSVALAVPAGFGVTGSPITSAGTFTLTTNLSGIIKGTGSGFATDPSLTAISTLSPTKGTIIVGTGSTWVTIGAGVNDQVLTADSTQVAGVKWGVGDSHSYATTIGDGTSTSFTVTHNLATQDIDVVIRSANTPFDVQVISWQAATLNTAIIGPFDTPPMAGQYRVVVLSHGGTGSIAGTGSGSVTNVSVIAANGFVGTVGDPTGAAAITLTTSVTGLVKGNGTALMVAVAGTDYLTPVGNGSGLTNLNATNLASGTVPIARLGTSAPSASNYLRGDNTWAVPPGSSTGTVTSVALAVPSGFSITGSPVTTAGTITITTNLSGIVKGTGTGLTTAIAGTDYLIPAGNGSQLVGITGSQISGNISGNAAGITGTLPGSQVSGNISGNAAGITGTLPGSQVSGNIPGNAASITGSITEGQVTGLTANLASKAIDTSVVHITGTETISGVKTFSNTITGSISGNAGTVTNGVYTTSTYADPPWLTSLSGTKISGNISGNAVGVTGTVFGSQVSGNIPGNAASITGSVTASQVNAVPTGMLKGVSGAFTAAIAGTDYLMPGGSGAGLTGVVLTTGSYSNPPWLTSLAGTKITGDIPGNAASITGSITELQVTNLTSDLAGKQPVNPTLTSLAGATYANGTLLLGQGTGVPTTVNIGSGLTLSSGTLTATSSGASPGGVTGDMQWNNAGVLAGGGPTWNGSSLFTVLGQVTANSASVAPTTGPAVLTINNKTTGQGASIYFSDAGVTQFILGDSLPGGFYLRDMAASINVLTCAPNGSIDLVGTPTAPTAAVGTNTRQIATTAFVLANAGTGGTGTPGGAFHDIQINNGAGGFAGGGPTWNSPVFSVTGRIDTSTGFRVTTTGTYVGVLNANRISFENIGPSVLARPNTASQVVFGVLGASGQTAPLQSLQGLSSSSTAHDIGYIDAGYNTPFDAIFAGYLDLDANDYIARRKGIRIAGDGTKTLMSFFGVTPVARQTGDVATGLVNLGLFSTATIGGVVIPQHYTWLLGSGSPATVGADKSNWITMNRALVIFTVSINAKTPPVGSSLIIDILYSTDSGSTWTSIWTTTANRLALPAGTRTASTTTFNTTSLAAGALLRIDIIQVGSTTAGQDITVQLST